mgnify:CR=1 FL=1
MSLSYTVADPQVVTQNFITLSGLLSDFSLFLGLLICLFGFFQFKRYGESRTMMSSQHSIAEPLVTVLGGVMSIWGQSIKSKEANNKMMMAMMSKEADVIDKALTAATRNIELRKSSWPIISLSPRGKSFTQEIAKKLAKNNGMIILCGRFEGIDQRVIDKWKMCEISLGDFVLTGGEVAAQAIIDATVRNIPSVLGNSFSIENESFNHGLLEHPQYTRPSNWDGIKVPEVLLSGNHLKIQEWQNQKSIETTKNRRPDLLEKFKKNQKAP